MGTSENIQNKELFMDILRALKEPESPCEVDVFGYVLWHVLRMCFDSSEWNASDIRNGRWHKKGKWIIVT